MNPILLFQIVYVISIAEESLISDLLAITTVLSMACSSPYINIACVRVCVCACECACVRVFVCVVLSVGLRLLYFLAITLACSYSGPPGIIVSYRF